MGQILKAANDHQPLNIHGTIVMPCVAIPSCRTHHAIEHGIDKNFLIRAFGGIGDQVCAEPSVRYAINHFPDCEVSVESLNPDLFQHLKLKGNFNEKDLTPEQKDQYFCFQSMFGSDHLAWEFLCHMIVQCVDYPALNMWRCQLPTQERNVVLIPHEQQREVARAINPKTDVVIHPGRNWQSKTLPVEFWDKVIQYLVSHDSRPILIGGRSVFDDKGGTVDVDTTGCIDLRNLLAVMQTTAVCQTAKVVLTNDSAPLHLAASGEAWIGFISTVKHPDYITHWRKAPWDEVIYGWRMKNHSKGGMWETMNLNPNHTSPIFFDKCDEELIRKWLPDPIEYAQWALEKLNG